MSFVRRVLLLAFTAAWVFPVSFALVDLAVYPLSAPEVSSMAVVSFDGDVLSFGLLWLAAVVVLWSLRRGDWAGKLTALLLVAGLIVVWFYSRTLIASVISVYGDGETPMVLGDPLPVIRAWLAFGQVASAWVMLALAVAAWRSSAPGESA